MRTDDERLLDILEAINRIYQFAPADRAAFDSNRLIQNWFVSHMQIIGEASQRLSQKLKAAHPEVPWKEITGMRNILVHHYFDIDLDVVWNIFVHDLPPFKIQIEAMIKDAP